METAVTAPRQKIITKMEETEHINQQPIDYEKVDDVLQKQREIAKAYLCQSIGE